MPSSRGPARLGMEVAMDLALQASPDHPWVTKHPEWFTTRADGSIAYAENPPKKYQDIYPINFDNDPEGIYAEVRAVVRSGWTTASGSSGWTTRTPSRCRSGSGCSPRSPRSDPDVIFLAEAFTRPAMMHALAKIGFHQSYTYFTWRNTAGELTEYLTELSGPAAPYMRPNFFVNTPDILCQYLQHAGPPAFAVRAVLAAMMSPSWGCTRAMSSARMSAGAWQRGVPGFGEILTTGLGTGTRPQGTGSASPRPLLPG